MSHDDAAQQLDEWKQKYYESISSLEKQQVYEDLLQRSLGRLALAAQGLDSSLDKQLKSLRKTLRSKSDQKDIQYILDQMEKAIARMEVNKAKDETQSSGEVLSELLKSLKLRKPFKADARKLATQFKSASSNEVSSLIPELLLLLNNCMPDGTEKSSRGFSFHLFGIGKPKKDDPKKQTAPDNNDASTLIDDDATANETPIHLMLMQLLERLSLPTELSKQSTKLRHKLEKGIEEDELPQVINEIADIVSMLGSMVITEKQEYQQFLTSLTSRLNELDLHIRQTGTDNAEAFKERESIGQAVESEVLGLRDNVAGADNLEQLKSTVTDRLDSLNQHFELYQKSDHDRFEQSQQEIIDLNHRIEQMEEETTELRESAEKSRDLALKDALTGIWNRQALNEILDKEFARWQRYQSPLSIIIWDVDFFKRVNDNYGHAAGDKVLRTIARIFQKATRDADFISRFGGEEFMGVFPETRLEDALTLANKIREKVELSKFHYEDKRVFITASAGLATFRPGDTIDDVFKRADKALYQAKQGGRNRCNAED